MEDAETREARQERAAKTQSIFREVNERIGQLESPVEQIGFACECSNVGCNATVPMTLAEYEEVRRIPTHFVVLPGHIVEDVERVVAGNGGYTVVEKFGAAGRVAVELDPRSRRRKENEALRTENEQLRTALSSRIVIEQAKGALSAQLGVSPEEAFALLRDRARSSRRKIHDVAAEVVASRGRLGEPNGGGS
jgi:hypothetical protein